MQGKRIGATVVAAAAILGMCLGAATPADAHEAESHEAKRSVVVRPYLGIGFGHYWGPYWGGGWWGPWGGPFWGPYANEPSGPTLGQAMIAGFGAVDMNVKPNKAEVWVDGKYIAEARDLDGRPTYLWLKDGDHDIQLYEHGYVTVDKDVTVRAGTMTDLNVRLEQGTSVQPNTEAQPHAQAQPSGPAPPAG